MPTPATRIQTVGITIVPPANTIAMEKIIRDPGSEFQRQLLTTMARLEPAQWKLMEQMLDQLLQQRQQSTPPGGGE